MPLTSLYHISKIKGRRRGWSTQKSKNLNEIFLFGKHANLTNIGEWFEIPKGRKWVFEPIKSQFHWTLTRRTRSNFFKIVLLHCWLVQVILEPVNLRSSRHDWSKQLLRSYFHPNHDVMWLVLKSAFLSRFYIIIFHLKYH